MFRAEAKGKPLVFDNAGVVAGNEVFKDRQTASRWQQSSLEAISGPLQGEHLKLYPFLLTSWEEWRRLHPGTLVLKPLPGLAPAPGTTLAAAPTALPTPRVFRCTCSSPGTWTEWAGNVSSSNYLLARQSARGQCANFLLNENAPSAFIPMQGTTINQQRPTIFNGTAFTQRAQVATSVGQSGLRQRSSVTPLTTECSQCACN